MKNLIYTLTLASLMGASLAACQSQAENKEVNTDESAVAVTLHPVESRDYAQSVISSGLISTPTEARLSFKIGGIIQEIAVREGDNVSKGQLLASLNLTEINAQLAQAEANVAKLKRDEARVQKLYADSAVTLEQVQNLKTALDVAQNQLTIARFNQQHAKIYATSNGKVIRKLANEGELIGAGTPLIIINEANENSWIVKVGVPDVDWIRLQEGDKAEIVSDLYKENPFQGQVKSIGQGADPLTGLYTIEVAIQAGERRIASGMFAQVNILPSQTQSYQVIPIEALVEGKGKKAYVFVPGADAKSVKKIPITSAFVSDNKVFITKGLEGVGQVITSGSAFLTEYSQIRIQP
ncbi:efflux RND transporter periplasmic adaptor subunit [Cytophagales bacterium LB-30]|uniref:Efflux RND transporter periplasmic adaptor subunit n=1 Tax=Shiella aurantiaca TaxID=3058365 RepID=A0ABT8F0H2_9BACT|nr:efflux RND transporter periplasmic adaptor subunit [Shiella aurantiaca]MDN4163936.1 efflux RND transporter periplasmic adaptor subunit [Shiella aurantiaca]